MAKVVKEKQYMILEDSNTMIVTKLNQWKTAGYTLEILTIQPCEKGTYVALIRTKLEV